MLECRLQRDTLAALRQSPRCEGVCSEWGARREEPLPRARRPVEVTEIERGKAEKRVCWGGLQDDDES